MQKSSLALVLAGVLTMPALAQYPAGTPGDDRASPPSTMGNPTPHEEVETRKDEQGRTVTEDGRPVVTPKHDREAEPSTDPTRHSAPGGHDDPSTSAGELD